jgi:hypothetical protein
MSAPLLCVLFCLTAPLGEEFEQFMGKGTRHWDNLVSAEDVATLREYEQLYAAAWPLSEVESVSEKIPHVVHFIWLGPRPFPPESVNNVRTWMAKNPSWQFKFWTDRDRDPPCNGMEKVVFDTYPFPRLGACYATSANWGEKSDLLRFEILFSEGGVYVDHDANCLIPFESLHATYDFYCGLEAPHPPVAGYRLTVGNGVIGARPGHPTVQKTIEVMKGHWDMLARKYPGTDSFSRTQIVMERTYLALTKAVSGSLNRDGRTDIVLPAAYFFAKPGITPLYSRHFFANAWADVDNVPKETVRNVRREISLVDAEVYRLSRAVVFLGVLNWILIASSLWWMRKWRT